MLDDETCERSELGSDYHELKDRLHQRVIEVLDLNAIGTMSTIVLRATEQADRPAASTGIACR